VMKNYLSFGGGVNSVAMMLLLLDEGVEFESVYVWMPDNPNTHEYIMMLESMGYPITIIFPQVKSVKAPLGPMPGIYYNLFDYCWDRQVLPSFMKRWCSGKFKSQTLEKYYQNAKWIYMGIDYGEQKRMSYTCFKTGENRYPLVEYGMNRKDCVELIKSKGLPVPMKSGCFICPFQDHKEWKNLRRYYPDLFCKATELEKRAIQVSEMRGGNPSYLSKYEMTLDKVIEDKNRFLFDDMAYPPCQCGL
jgi:hypothetical protein